MLLFLDTEFTGLDQAKPDLISIAIVDEVGREFYAELPEEHWTVQCNEWVHFNVLPHLWGGDYIQIEVSIREKLITWIESTSGDAVIVTDCPDADFSLLKRLLSPWPRNLASDPLLFNFKSMGEDKRDAIQKLMDDFHSLNRPKHHALHDAHALRLAYELAAEKGWWQTA